MPRLHIAAHCHGQMPDLWMVQALNAGIAAVHIDMQDGASHVFHLCLDYTIICSIIQATKNGCPIGGTRNFGQTMIH